MRKLRGRQQRGFMWEPVCKCSFIGAVVLSEINEDFHLETQAILDPVYLLWLGLITVEIGVRLSYS